MTRTGSETGTGSRNPSQPAGIFSHVATRGSELMLTLPIVPSPSESLRPRGPFAARREAT
jgi:hypothetical protein